MLELSASAGPRVPGAAAGAGQVLLDGGGRTFRGHRPGLAVDWHQEDVHRLLVDLGRDARHEPVAKHDGKLERIEQIKHGQEAPIFSISFQGLTRINM